MRVISSLLSLNGRYYLRHCSTKPARLSHVPFCYAPSRITSHSCHGRLRGRTGSKRRSDLVHFVRRKVWEMTSRRTGGRERVTGGDVLVVHV